MTPPPVFNGFSPECVQFFADLETNNDTGWFAQHREVYDREVLEPARRFVEEMGPMLEVLVPGIAYDPRVNRSLFKIHRDTRFSKDKTPFKTHLGIWFWEGESRMDSPGFYLEINAHEVLVAAGVYYFAKDNLARFRDRVAIPRHATALVRAVNAVEAAGFEVMGEHYVRVPKGYDPAYKHARFLRFNSLGAIHREPPPPELSGPEFLDWCFERFSATLPIHRWLKAFM